MARRYQRAYPGGIAKPRLLLLMAAKTYRAKAFMTAARRLGVDVVVGSDEAGPLSRKTGGTQLGLDLARPARSATRIVKVAEERPFDAIVNVDDATTVVAAEAATRLGLVSNSVDAARTTRSKYLSRRALKRAGLPVPQYRRISVDAEPRGHAGRVRTRLRAHRHDAGRGRQRSEPDRGRVVRAGAGSGARRAARPR